MWYCKDTRLLVEQLCGTEKTRGDSRATMWYCKDTRASVEPLCGTVKTPGCQ